jgi:hypothetical protein
MWRFVAVQTAISVAINMGIGAAIARIGATVAPASTVHDVAVALVPSIVIGSFMSALVPTMITRRQPVLASAGAALAVGLLFAALGVAALGLLAPAQGSFGSGTALAVRVVCGGMVGLVVTPVALLATTKPAYRRPQAAAGSLPKTSDNADNSRSICPSVPTVIRR